MPFQKGRAKTGGRKLGVANKRTRQFNAEVAKTKRTPLEHMVAETADQDRRDRMAIAAAPYLHPRLAVIDSTVQAKVEVSQLTPEQRRERARAAIAEAFAERSPPVIAGEYRVVGGREVPVAHKQAKSEPPEERDG